MRRKKKKIILWCGNAKSVKENLSALEKEKGGDFFVSDLDPSEALNSSITRKVVFKSPNDRRKAPHISLNRF